jgi:hypothetical protein
MSGGLITFGGIVAITLAASIVPAYAAEITDKTPCSQLMSAMDSENRERIRETRWTSNTSSAVNPASCRNCRTREK